VRADGSVKVAGVSVAAGAAGAPAGEGVEGAAAAVVLEWDGAGG
jgi:hypothetical protein